MLGEIATFATPETLLAWHRKLIAPKYDGNRRRGPGRPRVMNEIRELIAQMNGRSERTLSRYSFRQNDRTLNQGPRGIRVRTFSAVHRTALL